MITAREYAILLAAHQREYVGQESPCQPSPGELITLFRQGYLSHKLAYTLDDKGKIVRASRYVLTDSGSAAARGYWKGERER